ncbi:MAG: fibrinogen-like YCDxxxxGGGW domain-containing protein [Candidatus Absconditabacteria bacterium]
MAKSIKKFLKSFTLIELIIVIAIIVVLGASAFLMLSQWMSKSRDSRKISDLSRIDTAINISFTSKDKLPTPDNKSDITFGGAKVWELGFFGDDAVNQIGGALTKTPFDPTTKAWYRYAVWNNKYQLGTIIENEQFSKYLNRTYAQSYFTKVQGNYNQSIIVAKIGADDVIIPAPSLIVDEFEGEEKLLEEEYFWTNKNSYDFGEEQKNKLQVQTLFSGDISELQDPDTFNEFKTKFTDTYSGGVYVKELTQDLDENKIKEIVSAELKKVSSQNVIVQYLSCDGISNGQTKLFYKESNVAFGQSCDLHKKEFKCENGVWKDGTNNADLELYKYTNCVIGPGTNCQAATNLQKSTTNLDIVFDIPATNHGLGFEVEAIINENNGTYKYSLNGTCSNGIFDNIILGAPQLQGCNSDFIESDGSCIYNANWTGNNLDGFIFEVSGENKYPMNCNGLLVSTIPNFKYGTDGPWNGTKFVDGVYWIKPNTDPAFKVYCDMTTDGGGWTVMVSTAVNQASFDSVDYHWDITKSWNWKRTWANKLTFTQAAIKYQEGNFQKLDYNTTYQAYYNNNYAVQLTTDNCTARIKNRCGLSYPIISWGYFCWGGNPFTNSSAGASKSAFPGNIPNANSDNLGTLKCNSSNRQAYGSEFGTLVMVR